MQKQKLIIIGSGPAGLTAAIYAARADLAPQIFAGTVWGGQLMNTTEVENFPGFPEGVMGPVLINNMVKQAQKFGTQLAYQDVKRVDFSDPQNLRIYTQKAGSEVEHNAEAVIIATGAKPRTLGIPGEKEYWGRGVSSCATCDGAFYRDKVVAVIGGGDSAMEEATFLTKFASKVYLIHRRADFRASKIMQERARSNAKIEIIMETEVEEVLGAEAADAVAIGSLRAQPKVNAMRLRNNSTNEVTEVAIDGFFLGIGYIPETEIFSDYIDVRPDGYAVPATDEHFHTMSKVPGVFIAGDVEDHLYRQAITAAAAGCMAALDAERWLASNE